MSNTEKTIEELEAEVMGIFSKRECMMHQQKVQLHFRTNEKSQEW